MSAEDAVKVFDSMEEAETEYGKTLGDIQPSNTEDYVISAHATIRALFAEQDNLTVRLARWEAEHEDYKLELSRENILQAMKIQELEEAIRAK